MGKNRYPNFRGLLTARVVKSHVKLHVKTDVQKIHCGYRGGKLKRFGTKADNRNVFVPTFQVGAERKVDTDF